LKWARAFETWDKIDWGHVGFSDESKFVVFGAGGPVRFWKKRGAKLKPSNVKQVIKFGGGSVMVWGYITRLGVGKIHRIQGTMNTAKYIHILSNVYLRSLPDFGLRRSSLIFQHDNDPKHTSRGTTKWLIENKIRVLPWPPNSPDMNPIEHVWDYLDKQIRLRRPLPQNPNALWTALKEEWYNIPSSYIASLYDSMPNRIEALRKARGGHTTY
jgi:transposase